jgi:hypothetical protein
VLLLPLAALAERASRMLGTGVVVFGYAAALLTVSRGGVLGAVAGAGAFVVLRRPTVRRIAVALLGFVVIVAVLLLAAGGSVGVHAEVWAESLRLIAAHPLGVGLGRAGPLLATARRARRAWPPPAGAGRARGPYHADPGRGAVEGRCRL